MLTLGVSLELMCFGLENVLCVEKKCSCSISLLVSIIPWPSLIRWRLERALDKARLVFTWEFIRLNSAARFWPMCVVH